MSFHQNSWGIKMKDSLLKMKEGIAGFWRARTKNQKIIGIGSIVLVLAIISILTYLSTHKTLVPLYSGLSPSEAGAIKENLDSKGIENAVSDNGTTISVPEESVDTLKVQLASEGLPNTGQIDYSYFSQNAGLGMTENEFNVVKLAAMQTEIANLIKKIDGVQDASVMITMPEKGVFVSDKPGEASASVVLTTKPGYQFDQNQINALYRLVSKSVPNLPTDNIVIMNQNFEYYDLQEKKDTVGTEFATQQEIKKEVERDLQRQVQNMLGTLMGQDKVMVSVTTDIDFTQEKRNEKLVTPVDQQNMAGIAISAQKINETYTGNGNTNGGVPSSQNPADTLGSSYAAGSNGNGDYEKVQDTTNYEVNRINRQIVESPYKIKDIGIQVMVEPPKPNDPNSLPQNSINDINNILGSIIRTSLPQGTNGQPLTQQQINNKIAISVQPFNGKPVVATSQQSTGLPLWAYIVGGVLLLAIIVLIILFIRSRRKEDDEEEMIDEEVVYEVPDLPDESDSEASVKRKQLEKLAKDKPDDFAKLLRSWIAED